MIGTAGTNIFAAWNHQHPIVAMTVPTIGNITITGLGVLASQGTTVSRATEETVSYTLFVQWTTTTPGTWAIFTMPSLIGMTLVSATASTDDPNGGISNARMKDGVTNYSSPTTFYAQIASPNRTVYTTFQLTYVLN